MTLTQVQSQGRDEDAGLDMGMDMRFLACTLALTSGCCFAGAFYLFEVGKWVPASAGALMGIVGALESLTAWNAAEDDDDAR